MCACRLPAGPVLGVQACFLQPGRGGDRKKREGGREGRRREMGGRQESILYTFYRGVILGVQRRCEASYRVPMFPWLSSPLSMPTSPGCTCHIRETDGTKLQWFRSQHLPHTPRLLHCPNQGTPLQGGGACLKLHIKLRNQETALYSKVPCSTVLHLPNHS